MLSSTLDAGGSPKKRPFSRGMSEDESLRSIISESESSSRRLTRSDSRAGTLKRRTDSQSDQELFVGLPEMLELQTSYEEVVQELRGLEVERETLLFQVDVLQDTLEGVEELLAEAQREAGHASLELDREREAKKKLELVVSSLLQEVQRLKEPTDPAPTNPSRESTPVAHGDQPVSPLCETLSGLSPSGGPAEERGRPGVGAELRRPVHRPPQHQPSLALEVGAYEDGVHRRPPPNDARDEPDLCTDPNDSDSVSAYEDASAETPELDNEFPGDGEAAASWGGKGTDANGNRQGNGGESQDPKNPDSCILS